MFRARDTEEKKQSKLTQPKDTTGQLGKDRCHLYRWLSRHLLLTPSECLSHPYSKRTARSNTTITCLETGGNMAGSAQELFQLYRTQKYEPLLKGVRGTYLFDIDQVGSWFVSVEDGAVRSDEKRQDAEYAPEANRAA